jgi:hypothetical protein
MVGCCLHCQASMHSGCLPQTLWLYSPFWWCSQEHGRSSKQGDHCRTGDRYTHRRPTAAARPCMRPSSNTEHAPRSSCPVTHALLPDKRAPAVHTLRRHCMAMPDMVHCKVDMLVARGMLVYVRPARTASVRSVFPASLPAMRCPQCGPLQRLPCCTHFPSIALPSIRAFAASPPCVAWDACILKAARRTVTCVIDM